VSDDNGPGGSSLHYGNPWADPAGLRDPARQLRGRLPAPVTVWMAAGGAGLTVSSILVAQGEPPCLVGLIGPDTDLAQALHADPRFVVHLLTAEHRRLAQHFAGLLPAPDDQLTTTPSEFGATLNAVGDRAQCRLLSRRPLGWSELIEAEIVSVTWASPAPAPALALYRGAIEAMPRPRR
jgi:3-hydroxy-9,10-secoandrosta-1,3,5(10)-triene-9,17-dione monooxygenase reductase component